MKIKNSSPVPSLTYPHTHIPTHSLERRRFTLVELMIAMSILSIMMGMLVYMLQSTQRNWKWQMNRTKIYQNSRLAFDLIERDIRAIVTSSVPNQEIGYYVFDHDCGDATTSRVACFVSSTEPHDDATSRMCEITYRFHVDDSQPATRFLLQRQLVSDNDPANWNFFNRPSQWHLNDNLSPDLAEPETVIGGVSEFSIHFYDRSGAKIAAGDSTAHPLRIVVNMELFDENLSGDEHEQMRIKTRRAFSKIFYLTQIHK